MFEIGQLTRLPLGYVGENGTRTISIDMKAWLDEYPGALVMIQVIRPVDHYKYPAAYTKADGVIHWTVDGSEVMYAGKGFAQIALYNPDTKQEYKSRVVGTIVSESLDEFNEALEETDPANKWVNKVLAAESSTIENAAAAQAAAEESRNIRDDLITLPVKVSRTKTKTGRRIVIDDAVDNAAAANITAGAMVFSRNMYQLNAMNRQTNGITYTVDSHDPNTVHVDGTATSNAYSFGTITSINANMLLDAGTYYLTLYGPEGGSARLYYDMIPESTGVKTSMDAAANTLVTLTLDELTYVGVRVVVYAGKTADNETVRLYASKLKPLEYVPYAEPSEELVYAHSIIECPDDDGQVTYYTKTEAESETVTVATYNVGGYGYDESDSMLDPTGDPTSYRRYIADINADILCTQEDRIWWRLNQEKTRDEIYKYMYRNGDIVSNSVSTNGMWAKGIYTNHPVVSSGKYTYINMGVNADGKDGWCSFTYFVLRISGENVLVISTHLMARRNADLHEINMAARRMQVQETLDFVDTFRAEYGIEYVIIAGDFNNWSDEMLPFDEDYIRANGNLFGDFVTYDSASNHTFDNVIVTPNIKVRGVTVHHNNFKDHFALSAQLTV